MNRRIAAALVAASMVCGVGLGFLISRWNDGPADADTATPPSPSSSTSPRSGTPDDPSVELKIRPGGVGLIEAGMTGEQALSTGQVERDTKREQMCEGIYYRWKDAEARSALDLATDPDGTIVSIGISGDIYSTGTGVRIGDSLATLRQTYGDRLSSVQSAGYDQDGVFVKDGDRWLGFLLDSARSGIDDSTRVVFMEATKGNKPGLMRDGC